MDSPFQKIIRGEESFRVIAETDRFMACVEAQPLVLGHAIVFPKNVTDDLFDLTDADLGEMMVFAKRVASAVKKTVPCKKVGVAVIGLQVRHAHIHLVPIDSADDLNFTRAKLAPSVQDLSQMVVHMKRAMEC